MNPGPPSLPCTACPACAAVATLAMAMINLLPRRDLAEAGEGMEEGGEVRWGRRKLPAGRGAATAALLIGPSGLQLRVRRLQAQLACCRFSLCDPHGCCLASLTPAACRVCSRLQFRARLWLFVSFLIVAGAVAGSVAVLVLASQQPDLAGIGVVSLQPAAPCSMPPPPAVAAVHVLPVRLLGALTHLAASLPHRRCLPACRAACFSAASSWAAPSCSGPSDPGRATVAMATSATDACLLALVG
jgi:hypothetical protein